MRKVRRAVKVLLSYFLFYSGGLALVRWAHRNRKEEFHILMYHHITEKEEQGGLPLSAFRKQISWVGKYYSLVPLSEILLDWRGGKPFPKRVMAVTFDDGYRDFLTWAYPVLREKKIPVTLFAVVDCLSQKPLWTESLKYWFQKTGRKQLEISLNGETYSFSLGNEDEKLKSLEELKCRLKQIRDEERQTRLLEIEKALVSKEGSDGMPPSMLNWEEMLELSGDGVEIGAHTVSHPILSQVSLSEARHQIIESKECLEKYLGKPIGLFSYPNGKAEDFNEEIRNIVEEFGFLGACTTIEGKNDRKGDPYTLQRVATWERSLPLFACDLEGCFKVFQRLRRMTIFQKWEKP